jgi:glutathione S-transferase
LAEGLARNVLGERVAVEPAAESTTTNSFKILGMLSSSTLCGAPILYSFRRCPYAIRARLAIKVSGVRVALREVVLRDKPAALLVASGKATVPVLQLPDGRVLEQSLEIMRWALEQHDPQGWLCLQEQEEALALIALNDGPFKQALDRYKYAPRHPERPAHAWRDEAVELMLAPLNARLADRRFLLRDTPSLADMAIAPFIRQFAAVEPGWFHSAPFEPLQAWMNRIVSSELFDAVMTKFAPWQPGNTETTF